MAKVVIVLADAENGHVDMVSSIPVPRIAERVRSGKATPAEQYAFDGMLAMVNASNLIEKELASAERDRDVRIGKRGIIRPGNGFRLLQ